LKEDLSNENTFSDAADEGCTSKILQAAAPQHGKANSFSFFPQYSHFMLNYSPLFWNNSRILSNCKISKIIPA